MDGSLQDAGGTSKGVSPASSLDRLHGRESLPRLGMRVKTAHPTFNNTIGAIDMTKQNLTLGENIRAKRVEAGLTQQELAELVNDKHNLNLTQSVISALERGVNVMSNSRRDCVLNVLGLDPTPPNKRPTFRYTDQELDFQIPEIVKIPFYTVRNGMVLKVLTFQVLGPVADVIEDTGKLVKALEEMES